MVALSDSRAGSPVDSPAELAAGLPADQEPSTSGGALEGALQGDDPATGLRGVVALRALADQLEFLHVQRARERGWSWQEIAAALGISRQAVHKKYGRRL